jgi:hypothetical protein
MVVYCFYKCYVFVFKTLLWLTKFWSHGISNLCVCVWARACVRACALLLNWHEISLKIYNWSGEWGRWI